MPIAPTARVHPTALVSPEADLADRVEVGPYAILEGPVRLGPGCVIRPHVHLVGPLAMGSRNVVYTGAVLGERPQHLKYNDEPTRLEIGDDNIFREFATVHRGTAHAQVTRVGSNNFLMANSHVAHDCVVGNRCILANGALLAGHCVLEDGVYLSGNSAVHQFVRVGRLAMLSGCSVTSHDIPPFVIQQGQNCVVGVNVVGMRRAGLGHDEINGVRRAFAILFSQGNVVPVALLQAEKEVGHVPAVQEMLTFIRNAERGINSMRDRHREAA